MGSISGINQYIWKTVFQWYYPGCSGAGDFPVPFSLSSLNTPRNLRNGSYREEVTMPSNVETRIQKVLAEARNEGYVQALDDITKLIVQLRTQHSGRKCPYCMRYFKDARGLAVHMAHCKKKPVGKSDTHGNPAPVGSNASDNK